MGWGSAVTQTEIRMETTAIEKLGAAIEQALADAPASDVLSILTGSFVSLTLELLRRQGHDVNKEVKIDGGSKRDITIHAPKDLAAPSENEQVAPEIDQTGTVSDELLAMLKQIRDFRHFTPEFKKTMDEVIAKADRQQLPESDLVQFIGIKNGVETLLGQAPMPPKMKARHLVRETFGHFDDADGSDAELCFGVCEQLIDHMAKSGFLIGC